MWTSSTGTSEQNILAGPDVQATAVAAGDRLCRRRQRILTSIFETFLLEWRTERYGQKWNKEQRHKTHLQVDVHLKRDVEGFEPLVESGSTCIAADGVHYSCTWSNPVCREWHFRLPNLRFTIHQSGNLRHTQYTIHNQRKYLTLIRDTNKRNIFFLFLKLIIRLSTIYKALHQSTPSESFHHSYTTISIG